MSITNTSVAPSNNLPPVTRSDIETLVSRLEKPSKSISGRLETAGVLIDHIYRWNSQNGGRPNSWDAEKDFEYIQKVTGLIANVTLISLIEFLDSCNSSYDFSFLEQPEATAGDNPVTIQLPAPGEPIKSPTMPGQEKPEKLKKEPVPAQSKVRPNNSYSPPAPEPASSSMLSTPSHERTRSLTAAQALEVARTKVGTKDHRGKTTRGGGTVAGNHRAIEVIKLLHRSGGLTLDQLRFLMNFSNPKSKSTTHELQTTAKLLRSTKPPFIGEVNQLGWRKSPMRILYLTQAGEAFYTTLPDGDKQGLRKHASHGKGNLAHHYGIYQTLTSIAGQLTTTNQLLPKTVNNIQLLHLPDDVAQTRQELSLDWRVDVTLSYPANPFVNNSSQNLLRPDAFGSIQFDSELAAHFPNLFERAKLPTLESYEKLGVRGASSARHEYVWNDSKTIANWNFLLEYDCNTEGLNQFGRKATAYAKLASEQYKKSWPPQWQRSFPSILVVTTGGPVHMLNMMAEVTDKLAAFEHKYGNQNNVLVPYNWLFTMVDWIKVEYSQQLGSFNARREKVNWEGKLDGQVWLPLSVMLDLAFNRGVTGTSRERRAIIPERMAELRQHIVDLDKCIKKEGRCSITNNLLFDRRVGLPIHWKMFQTKQT
jgi:hypothetical protein